MKAYGGCRKRAAKQYNGDKSQLCYHWRAPLIKWCRRVDRQEGKIEIREQLAN